MTGSRPLDGVRVLVTRSAHQAGELVERLTALGARPIVMPAIEIKVLESSENDATFRAIESFDWVCFASPNAVRVTIEQLDRLDMSEGSLRRTCVAAVGHGTAGALRSAGIDVELVPEVATGAALGVALAQRGVSGAKVLVPGSQRSRRDLDGVLEAAGADVTRIDCYTSTRPSCPQTIDGSVDVATFYSPSALQHTLDMLERDRLERSAIVCIGETTAGSVRDHGLAVAAVAEQANLEGMIDAIIRATNHRGRDGR